jgi:hypothetical protein
MCPPDRARDDASMLAAGKGSCSPFAPCSSLLRPSCARLWAAARAPVPSAARAGREVAGAMGGGMSPTGAASSRWSCGGLACLRTSQPSLLASEFELVVALSPHLVRTTQQAIRRRDVADRAVQPHVVVVRGSARRSAPRCVAHLRATAAASRGWRPPFKGLVPALELAVGLRVARCDAHVRHARDANEPLKSYAMSCGSLSEMMCGRASGQAAGLTATTSWSSIMNVRRR